MHKRNLALSAGLMLAFARQLSAQVTIEIVNDSGRPDTNVFIMAPGKYWSDVSQSLAPVTPTNLFVNINGTNLTAATATSLPLTFLATSNSAPPYLAVSSISGRTNTVYSFQADYIASGSIYFTYDNPFVFTNALQPSPPPDSTGNAYRYDYAELSIKDTAAANNAMDVTYVDKFGIPLQMEWFRGSNLVSGSYVYLSTKTMVDRFSENGLGQAVFALTSNNITAGWTYAGPSSYTNFARILAPQKVSGTSTSVSPYPSITNYLNSLVGNPFWMNGAAPQGGYYYEGYIASMSTNAGGWLLTLTKGAIAPPYNTNIIVGTNYTNTITVPISNTNASQYIYGAPVGPNMYATNGVTVVTNLGPAYNVEVWMIGDALSAINFGFWGGNYGTNSAVWYSPVIWTSYPFGSARPTPDEYYNVYAALIYDYSDPYSFAFSERITPDVLMAPTNGDRVRITILPDDRLDSAIAVTPTASDITSNSITLNWTPSAGATGYVAKILQPLNMAPIILPGLSASYTFTNLQPGTPYIMSVQAMGTGAGGNPVITPARAVPATTLGTLVPAAGNFTIVQGTFNASDPFYQLSKVYINGTALYATNNYLTTNGVYSVWTASQGTNQVAVTVVDTNNQIVFNNWLSFTLAPQFSGNLTAISNIVFNGQKLSQPAPTVTGFISGNANGFQISTSGPSSVTIQLTYVPAETRKFAPVKPITPPVSGVLITNVAGIPGGGIRFSFNVPQGTNYAIITSTNVAAPQASWLTNATGVGQAGLTSYTNAAGGNAMQYYRIKY